MYLLCVSDKSLQATDDWFITYNGDNSKKKKRERVMMMIYIKRRAHVV